MSKIGNRNYNLKKIGNQAFLIKVRGESYRQERLQKMADDLVRIMIHCQAKKALKKGDKNEMA